MKLVWVIIKSLIIAIFNILLYVILPTMIINYFSLSGDTIEISEIAQIKTGDWRGLVAYITGLGYLIAGISFATSIAPEKTVMKAVWKIIQFLISISFWAIFIVAKFTNIIVFTSISSDIGLVLDLDITQMFWVLMGGNIFALIIAIFDLFLALYPEMKWNKNKTESINNSPLYINATDKEQNPSNINLKKIDEPELERHKEEN